MTQKVQLWNITDNRPSKIEESTIDYEQQLEDWLADDISLLDSNLLAIGRQVRTAFGGIIDILCLDREGNTVVVELKKKQAPREVTAQALDYASWVSQLSHEDLAGIAGHKLSNWGSLESSFEDRFEIPLPEILNAEHKSLIVAESMDESTERIVKYLSEQGVPINGATFQHFMDGDGKKILARVFLIEPEEADANARPRSKRVSQTVEGLRNMAYSNGMGELWDHMRDSVRGLFNWITYPESTACDYKFLDGRWRTLFFTHAVPREGAAGLPFFVHATRLSTFSGLDVNQIRDMLPSDSVVADEEARTWRFSSDEERQSAQGFKGQYPSKEDITRFINGLKDAQKNKQSKE